MENNYQIFEKYFKQLAETDEDINNLFLKYVTYFNEIKIKINKLESYNTKNKFDLDYNVVANLNKIKNNILETLDFTNILNYFNITYDKKFKNNFEDTFNLLYLERPIVDYEFVYYSKDNDVMFYDITELFNIQFLNFNDFIDNLFNHCTKLFTNLFINDFNLYFTYNKDYKIYLHFNTIEDIIIGRYAIIDYLNNFTIKKDFNNIPVTEINIKPKNLWFNIIFDKYLDLTNIFIQPIYFSNYDTIIKINNFLKRN